MYPNEEMVVSLRTVAEEKDKNIEVINSVIGGLYDAINMLADTTERADLKEIAENKDGNLEVIGSVMGGLYDAIALAADTIEELSDTSDLTDAGECDLISKGRLIEDLRKCYTGHCGMENSDSLIMFKSVCNLINKQSIINKKEEQI